MTLKDENALATVVEVW